MDVMTGLKGRERERKTGVGDREMERSENRDERYVINEKDIASVVTSDHQK